MKAFEYSNALSTGSAVSLSGKHGRYLAGGIDLLGEMKEYITSPPRLVNIKNLPGTRDITTTPTGYRIGANVRVAEIAAHPGFHQALPALAEAAAEVGSPQIRNVATLGGNLAQHSRCWYYRQRDLTCLKRGGNTCYGREGQNKYLAIFSGNPCVSPAVSNLAVALAVLDVSVVVLREGAETPLSIAQLYEDAWKNPLAHNSLRPGDLILAVEVPTPVGRSAYLQASEKSDFDWALVSCAASGRLVDGKISSARIALGAVAPVPFEVAGAAEFLEGKVLDDRSATAAADLILREAAPLAHNGYKIPIAHALIRRALSRLAV